MATTTDESTTAEPDEQKPAEPEAEPAAEADEPTQKSAEELRKELREGDRVRKRESAKKDKRIADLERQLKERADEDKSEQEKAIEKAREEGKAEAQTAAEKARRADRLDVAVTRAAAKSFADPDDALMHIQRRISSGDIDEATIFDDEGKVDAEALKSSLGQLLEDKPHLAADGGRPRGDADAGRRGGSTSLEEMSVDDHLKAISRH